MSDHERAMLDSKNDMEDALSRLEDFLRSMDDEEKELLGGHVTNVHIMRALCRAVYILLDWAIRKERSNGKQ